MTGEPGAVARTAEIIVATPTLFRADGTLDHDANRALLKSVPAGVAGVFVAGTTGEFPALTTAERDWLISTAVEEVGPDRVIAHVGAASAYQAVQLARAAVTTGVTRLAAITPYYLPAGPREVRAYFTAVADAVSGCPLYAYLFPERTTTTVSPAELAALAGIPGLVGAKLSGQAAERFADYAGTVPPEFILYSGDDSALPEVVAAGGHGVVSGVAAAFPHLFLDWAAAVSAEDTDTIERLRPLVSETVTLVGPSIDRLKRTIALVSSAEYTMRMPVETLTEHDVAQLDAAKERVNQRR